MDRVRQLETIGKELADVVSTAVGWETPLDGTEIKTVVGAFDARLKELSGE